MTSPSCTTKGRVQKRRKNSGIFQKVPEGPPPLLLSGKKEKKGLHDMNQILYDMGSLSYVRWLLKRAFKV